MKKKKKELIERWDVFLSKMEERFDDILDAAKPGFEGMLSKIEYDTVSISNACSGMKGQLYQITNKIEDTWNDKMDDLFGDRDDVSSKERLKELQKYLDVNQKLESKFVVMETTVLADAARKVYDRVVSHIDENKIHHCKQCGDKMDIIIYSFMAKNIKCNSCGTVNSYEPDARIIALENTITALADEKVLPITLRVNELNHKISDLDDRKKKQKIKIKEYAEEMIKLNKQKINEFYDFIISKIVDKEEFYNRKRVERLKWAEEVRY